MQNYRVAGGFGSYKPGSVLPEWAVARAGPVEEQVARGIVEPTSDPVNVDLRVPEPKTSTDPAPSVVDELNRLRKENESLASDNRTLLAQRDSYQRNVADRDRALGNQTADIEHLKRACEEHQAARDELEKRVAELTTENAALRADLDAATAPKDQPKTGKKTAAA